MFDSRTAVLSHIQQGTAPSPLDRICATRLVMCPIKFVEEHTSEALCKAHKTGSVVPIKFTNCKESAAVAGISAHSVIFEPVSALVVDTDMKNRKSRTAWWSEHRPVIDLLAGRNHVA